MIVAVDPRTLIRPDADLALPDGDDVVVTTDDGARLAVTVAGLLVSAPILRSP